MAATNRLYPMALTSMSAGRIDWAGGTVKGALFTDSYVFASWHEVLSDVTDEGGVEAAGAGYPAGGAALTGRLLDQDLVTNTLTWTADFLTWPAMSATFRYMVVYQSTGVPAGSWLIALVDFGDNVVLDGQPFTVQWTDGGVVQLTTA